MRRDRGVMISQMMEQKNNAVVFVSLKVMNTMKL